MFPNGYPKRVLVPLANPGTAPALLDLASRLDSPDEEGGKIFAMHVTLADQEVDQEVLDELQQIVKKTDNPRFAFIERVTISLERAILDAIRELNIDLVILGCQPNEDEFLSPSIKDVIEVTPCDVLIYRSAANHQIQNILVPVRANLHSQMAIRQGLLLAEAYDASVVALHVQPKSRHLSYGLLQIRKALAGIGMVDKIQEKVVQGNDIVREIVLGAKTDTLIVMGISEGNEQERWDLGTISQQVLRRFDGPVILVKYSGEERMLSALERLWHRFAPVMTVDEQMTAAQAAQEMARFNTNYGVLILLSASLATLGLLQNSAAVIIGAMLVAPLMSPLMGLGMGLAQNKPQLIQRSFITACLGVLMALSISVLIGIVAPLKIPTLEMQSRGEPTLLDMGVGLASGVVAAFALGRKDIPGAIAGVAIAAALMPPVCTTGLALAFGERDLFTGAGLLFVLNLVSISVAAYATFLWMGVRSRRPRSSTWQPSLLAIIALILFVIPATLALFEVTRQTRQRVAIQDTLEASFPEWDVLEVALESGTPLTITTTVRGEGLLTRQEIADAEEALEDRLEHDVKLEIVLLRLFTPPEEEPSTPEPE